MTQTTPTPLRLLLLGYPNVGSMPVAFSGVMDVFLRARAPQLIALIDKAQAMNSWGDYLDLAQDDVPYDSEEGERRERVLQWLQENLKARVAATEKAIQEDAEAEQEAIKPFYPQDAQGRYLPNTQGRWWTNGNLVYDPAYFPDVNPWDFGRWPMSSARWDPRSLTQRDVDEQIKGMDINGAEQEGGGEKLAFIQGPYAQLLRHVQASPGLFYKMSVRIVKASKGTKGKKNAVVEAGPIVVVGPPGAVAVIMPLRDAARYEAAWQAAKSTEKWDPSILEHEGKPVARVTPTGVWTSPTGEGMVKVPERHFAPGQIIRVKGSIPDVGAVIRVIDRTSDARRGKMVKDPSPSQSWGYFTFVVPKVAEGAWLDALNANPKLTVTVRPDYSGFSG